MSKCISMHGEYGNHTPDGDYICTRCEALDEDALIDERDRLRQRAEAAEAEQRHIRERLARRDIELHAVIVERDELQAQVDRMQQDLDERVERAEAAVRAERERALQAARKVITQYLATAEQWRYDRVVLAFAIMLGETPEDTPEPPAREVCANPYLDERNALTRLMKASRELHYSDGSCDCWKSSPCAVIRTLDAYEARLHSTLADEEITAAKLTSARAEAWDEGVAHACEMAGLRHTNWRNPYRRGVGNG